MESFIQDNYDVFLEKTFELSNQSIYWINSEGRIVFANQAACKRLDYTKEELLQKHVWEVNPIVDKKEKFQEIFHRYVSNDKEIPNILESLHQSKSGRIFPVEIASKVVQLNEEDFLISYVKDISMRIEKKEQLELYFDVINSSRDIIFLVDHETQHLKFANKTALIRLGYTISELREMQISDFRKPLKQECIETKEVFESILEKGYMTTLGQYICKDGSTFPVETSLSIKEYQGKDYIVAISRDISERLELDEKKEEVNQKLQNYNTTLEEEVEKAKDELISFEKLMYHQSKMAAMGEMLENIAHQWRQPLSIISVLATGMKIQSESDSLTKESLESGLAEVNKNSQYLSRTIDAFGDFFKPNKNKSSFNLREVIENALNLSASNVKSLDITIIRAVDDIVLFNHQNEFIQVLINLVNNAKDALKEAPYRRLIFIRAYEKEDMTYIEVKDNGGGINEAVMDKLFEPYFTTKHKSQGTGIGLYMSEEIVTKHMNGQITVANNEFTHEGKAYKGAKFTITLPSA